MRRGRAPGPEIRGFRGSRQWPPQDGRATGMPPQDNVALRARTTHAREAGPHTTDRTRHHDDTQPGTGSRGTPAPLPEEPLTAWPHARTGAPARPVPIQLIEPDTTTTHPARHREPRNTRPRPPGRPQNKPLCPRPSGILTEPRLRSRPREPGEQISNRRKTPCRRNLSLS